jgi:hypothetical protein
MGIIPLTITSICYLWVTIDMLLRGNYPMALMFACYSVANVALIWAAYR